MHRANSLSSLNIEASKQALPADMVSTQKRTFAFADAAYGDGKQQLTADVAAAAVSCCLAPIASLIGWSVVSGAFQLYDQQKHQPMQHSIYYCLIV
ncbi:hypothetical protein TYRP_001067 [Tyrophagus putrescentiae]|nr:hypothetical protein TYRP_001067 [Tyrophagus putrescentiae]